MQSIFAREHSIVEIEIDSQDGTEFEQVLMNGQKSAVLTTIKVGSARFGTRVNMQQSRI